ncbi:hypothetical protein H5410_018202 [Solanum commersonii]|uniref:Uncharacterized protein n=1 Tax=Solanum commersonii TaxID=4109 RepID=A0A9J6A247_SOLCO|nr:hypothetical protein H5410_018202 [Solanum commersonii]
MIQRIGAKIQAWKGKLLSYGGRAILIKHVLQSTHIHCLSVMNPPNNVLMHVQKMMAQFFWSSCIGGKGRHWTKWSNLCVPEKEGGLGIRLMTDISMALFCKLWWNFRTKPSLWSDYMRNKYCRNIHDNEVMWKIGDGGSQVWKKMLQARLRDLYTITGENYEWDETYQKTADLTKHGGWDVDILNDILPQELVNHIRQHIHPPNNNVGNDTPCWMLETNGMFSVKSAWQYIRHKLVPNRIYK